MPLGPRLRERRRRARTRLLLTRREAPRTSPCRSCIGVRIWTGPPAESCLWTTGIVSLERRITNTAVRHLIRGAKERGGWLICRHYVPKLLCIRMSIRAISGRQRPRSGPITSTRAATCPASARRSTVLQQGGWLDWSAPAAEPALHINWRISASIAECLPFRQSAHSLRGQRARGALAVGGAIGQRPDSERIDHHRTQCIDNRPLAVVFPRGLDCFRSHPGLNR